MRCVLAVAAVVAVLVLAATGGPVLAEEAAADVAADLLPAAGSGGGSGVGGGEAGKTPWLKGVTIPPHPQTVSPVLEARIQSADGTPAPATYSEDMPVQLAVESEIFASAPPARYREVDLSKGEWVGQPSVRWFFENTKEGKSTLASTALELPINAMSVTPLDPTPHGAVTVFLTRRMRYEVSPGRFQTIFVNASRGLMVRVLDVTPPTCGLEIKVGSRQGKIWTVENPPHQPVRSKKADVFIQGSLIEGRGQEAEILVAGLALEAPMVLDAGTCAIPVGSGDKIGINPLLQDNGKVDFPSVSYGISDGCEGGVHHVGPKNPTTIAPADLAKVGKPFLYLEAQDEEKNRQTIFIPLQVTK